MKRLIPVLFFLFTFSFCKAQSPSCIVMPEPLKGTYAGSCTDGKASGQGKATGIDQYEGRFKNGLPDGTGTYTWQNGNYYTGEYKKGVRSGKGEMHYRLSDNTDSVVHGFWKNDQYKGLYENPYRVIEMGPAVTYKDIRKINGNKSSVFISMETGVMAKANVDIFQIVNGSYGRTERGGGDGKRITIEFQDVEFPFRVKFPIASANIDIEFSEPGEWRAEIIL